ncbi:MAG: hypothetical protein JXN64_04375 [Spirochaetes bacterium]|nr:hypothetical protein [Spirochaetota bacterium]
METLAVAAQVIVTIIPIVGIVMGCAVIFFYIFYNHKQKMLMIEKGTSLKSNFDLGIFSIFTGLLLFCIGLCLTIFFALKEGISYSLLSGIIPLSCGVSLIFYYIIRIIFNKKSNAK